MDGKKQRCTKGLRVAPASPVYKEMLLTEKNICEVAQFLYLHYANPDKPFDELEKDVQDAWRDDALLLLEILSFSI